MIGNDVVDIALAKKDSNWERPGFIHKIFTPHEQQLITNSANAELSVWVLWSKKEAAYKVLSRQTGVRRFIPLKLECTNLETESEVTCSEHRFFVRTEANDESIHSVAVAVESDLQQVKELPNMIAITKVGALPFATDSLGALQPVSVSHHGKFHRIVTLARLFDPKF